MSHITNQNTEPLFIFDMPDDEVLSQTISVQGEKGERGDPTKTSQLINDSDYTTNAALNAGLATKADLSALQTTNANVAANTAALATIPSDIELIKVDVNSATRWYKLTTLPNRALTAYAAKVQLSGCIGRYHPNDSAQIDITIASRSVLKVTGDYYAVADTVASYADIEIYDQEDGTADVYIKAITSWVTVKLKAIFIDGCANEFNKNTYTTTQPSGTLSWALSTAPDVQKNIGGTISADITGDAATVNGHTVDADVPSDALFTDTVYDDTIISNQVSSMSAEIGALDARVDGLASGSPLVASSTSEMADTTRVYVNTTDGKWYYYDGSAWVVGGTYQATGVTNIADQNMSFKAITPMPLAHLAGYNLKDQAHWGYDYYRTNMAIHPTTHKIQSDSSTGNCKSVTAHIPLNSFITIKKSATSNRFRVGVIPTAAPAANVQTEVIFDDATQKAFTFYNESDSWVVVFYTSANETIDIDILVDNRSLIQNEVRAENMAIMETVDSDNLYDENNKIIGEGTSTQSNQYRYRADTTYRTYNFKLEPNTTYAISRNGGNKMRVCLWNRQPYKTDTDHPDVAGDVKYSTRPNKVVIDDDAATSVSFNSETFTWCTILYSNNQTDATFTITTGNNKKYRVARQYIADYLEGEHGLEPVDGGYVLEGTPNASNDIWSQWNARLAFGMNPSIAPVPTQFNGQIYVNGTIIAHNNSTSDRAHNRWGFHVYEAYANDNYSRMTMLLNKHDSEFDDKPSLEYYYYTGANHKEPSYGNVKIGSDVKYHSFMFNRDKMIAAGVVDCRFPIELARINPNTDIDATYETVAEIDAAYEPENKAVENSKCLKYVYLKNATNGAMWYDTARHKVVVKINGKWHDMNTTEVPDGTYNF